MTEHEGLVRALCESAGVAVGYHLISGQWVETPLASRVALLGALGWDASTPQACESTLRALELRRWSRLAEPVALVASDDPGCAFELGLARSALDAELRWRLVTESGEAHEGACRGRELGPRAEHWIGGEAYERRALVPGRALAPGYHRLECRLGDGEPVTTLVIAAPTRCWRPEALKHEGRVFGLAVQLHSVRSVRNWGIGDFGDLLRIVEFAAREGADLVGLNPLHALFADDPARASPYSPSSRRWLNPIYIDVDAALERLGDDASRARVAEPAFRARLAGLRAAPLVDRCAVAAAKDEVLRAAWRGFRDGDLARGSGRASEFRTFQTDGGRALRQHALFEAIQSDLRARSGAPVGGWPRWPEALRDPDSESVVAFERANADEVAYREFLQWLARGQLARAARRCAELGMRVGLYLDMAVSVDGGGSDTWRDRLAFALDVGVGAPPDDWNRKGQDWGLPPPLPEALRDQGFAPFLDALRGTMREAGALRIDHVMQLMRLFWIPHGSTAAEGGYVLYPLDEMAAIVALESQRNRCAIVGEDLGTVPDEVRAAMHHRGLLSYRLLYFERSGWGEFRPAAEFPRQALVAASTHDLPTLAGWWSGRDLDLGASLGLLPPERPLERLRAERAEDRSRLLRAVGADPAWAQGPMRPEIAEAVHALLASTPACLMVVQLEDLLLETEQANLPGTVEGHPNWRRKLGADLEALMTDPTALGILRAVAARRGRASGGG